MVISLAQNDGRYNIGDAFSKEKMRVKGSSIVLAHYAEKCFGLFGDISFKLAPTDAKVSECAHYKISLVFPWFSGCDNYTCKNQFKISRFRVLVAINWNLRQKMGLFEGYPSWIFEKKSRLQLSEGPFCTEIAMLIKVRSYYAAIVLRCRTACYCTEIAMLLHCSVTWKLYSF